MPKKEEPQSVRVEGLSIVAGRSPYEQISGTVFDMRGPWTEGLVDAWLAWEDETQPCGVNVWIGAAIVTDEWSTRHVVRVTFEGEWFQLPEDALAALGNGDRPLAMTSFPSPDTLLPLPT